MKMNFLFKAAMPIVLSLFCLSAMGQEANDESRYTADLLKVGTAAPNFVLKTSKEKMVNLKSYKGKYVVLDFWASWCPDCRSDAPNMVKAYNQFKDKGVAFIGISFDTDKTAWENAINKYGIEYPQVSELKKWKETSISAAYHIKWIPSMYLLDRKGKVVFATVNSARLVEKLEEMTK